MVALHPEGVDRNKMSASNGVHIMGVALHPEGVDRNLGDFAMTEERWKVALHPEGVDRNAPGWLLVASIFGRPPPGGRG